MKKNFDIIYVFIAVAGISLFVPFLGSLFFFIWISNLMGVIPGAQFPIMSSLAFPVSLTLMVYITYLYLGMKHQGPIKFFTSAMFPPGVPKAMYGLLAPLELLQLVVTRPVTQAIRLFANMFAGHLLLTTFTVGAYYLLSPSIIGFVIGYSQITKPIVARCRMPLQDHSSNDQQSIFRGGRQDLESLAGTRC